jgi:hypothetical protein
MGSIVRLDQVSNLGTAGIPFLVLSSGTCYDIGPFKRRSNLFLRPYFHSVLQSTPIYPQNPTFLRLAPPKMATTHDDAPSLTEDKPRVEYVDEKDGRGSATPPESQGEEKPRRDRLQNARDLVAEVLDLEDDPSKNPWTFRMWFLGLGVSCFGG